MNRKALIVLCLVICVLLVAIVLVTVSKTLSLCESTKSAFSVFMSLFETFANVKTAFSGYVKKIFLVLKDFIIVSISFL